MTKRVLVLSVFAFLLSATRIPAQQGTCPSADQLASGRALVAQLTQQVSQAGSVADDVRAKIGLLQTVVNAREAAVLRGSCDLTEYNAQLSFLVTDLQRSIAQPPASSPPGTLADPSQPPASPSPAAAASPSPAGSALSPAQPGAPDPTQASSSLVDPLMKIGEALKSLFGNTGGLGGNTTGDASVVAPVTPNPGRSSDNPPAVITPTPGSEPGGLRPAPSPPPKVVVQPGTLPDSPAVLAPPRAIPVTVRPGPSGRLRPAPRGHGLQAP